MSKTISRWLIVILVGVVIWLMPVPYGLEPNAWVLFAVFVSMILGFILQPLPMGAMAFITIGFIMISRVLTGGQILAGFSDGTIWLIICAFMFARALVKTGLGNRIAYTTVRKIGNSALKLGYALSISELIIAPATPSTTARNGGVLFPIALSISRALGSDTETEESKRKLGGYLMQVLCQSSGITSAMFMTAMAGNPMVAGLVSEAFGVEISWALWALAASVPGVLSLALMPLILYKVYPPTIEKTPEAVEIADKALKDLGSVTNEEKITAIVFVGALALWSTSQFTGLGATAVALGAVAIMLFFGVLTWNDILGEKGAWDTMMWMGVAMTMAGQLNSQGFIPWFSDAISVAVSGFPWFTTLLILVLVFMYSHYFFASLSAHIAAKYVAFVMVAYVAGAPLMMAVLSIAFVANLCLSLHHFSGGNVPILFNAGYVSLKTWWKLGLVFSVVNIVIWFGIGSVWWGIIGLY